MSETKRRKAFKADSVYNVYDLWGIDFRKVLPRYHAIEYAIFEDIFLYKMAAISKVVRLSQKPSIFNVDSMNTFCGASQKRDCRIHHAIVSAILEAILKKATIFKVIRVILETVRQRIVTLVCTYIN